LRSQSHWPNARRASRRFAIACTSLEVAEERAICEAERRWEQIDRREDASPMILFDAELLERECSPR